MKIWIYLNGVQQGPYELAQLSQLPLRPDTPVWYDGLPQWTPAAQAPATAQMFADAFAPAQAFQPAASVQQQATAPASECAPARPSTYFVWSILLTLLCCTPFSIAAIITGAISNSKYNSGDFAGAQRMSAATEWLVILSIVFGILALPLSLIFFL